MRCSTAKKILSEYIDGLIELKRKDSLEQHLKSCPGCREFLEDFREIKQKSVELEKFVPQDKSWEKIEKELKMQRQESPSTSSAEGNRLGVLFPLLKRRMAMASALILVVAAAFMFFGIRYRHAGRNSPQYTIVKLEEAEHYYQKAVKTLWEAASLQEEFIDPQLAEVFQENLKIVNSSMIACKQAVLENPGDIESRDYLLALYREKLDLLEEMMIVKESSFQKKEREILL
mgnify:CR=1 FL=1